MPKRTGSTRERTGCLTCRARKKKCDLQSPVCHHCHRLNFRCEWENPRLVRLAARTSSPPVPPTALQVSSPEPLNEVGQHPLSDPGRLAFPIGSEFRSASRSRAPLARHVIRYYVQQFTQLLTATRENDCFLSVFLPMAFEYPTLHNTVVAWAAAHLVMCAPSPSLHHFALESRTRALSALSTNLARPNQSREAELACCLVLSSMDSIMGDTDSWDLHVRGAAEILRPVLADENHAMASFLVSYDGRWLLRAFAYHDVLMSVTLDCAPLISGYYWQNESSGPVMADSYFGFASMLLYSISEISSLNAAMAAAIITEADFRQCSQDLESRLLSWKCPDNDDAALTALANMYRSAALLHLYSVACRNDSPFTATSHRKQRQVDAVIQSMHSMPLGSPPECTSLFPIFMCGTQAHSLLDTQIIRERLQAISVSRNFKNFETAISVLDELWRRRGIGTLDAQCTDKPDDWRAILREWGWKLSLS